jgi:hypothetical protein
MAGSRLGFARPSTRPRAWGLAAFCLGAMLVPSALGEERRESLGPELIDPIAGADAFAGETVKDREMGWKLMQARGKKVPKVGQVAPDFQLRSADGRQIVRLSSFRGKKPVVLIFGSHT